MAAGETSKSFQVLIVDDVYIEGDEFFFVTLSDPVGATLGTPNPATLIGELVAYWETGGAGDHPPSLSSKHVANGYSP